MNAIGTLYEQYEDKLSTDYTVRGIDGTVIGTPRAVGYCTYEEHPGFLTQKLAYRHRCAEKHCDHFVAKTKTEFPKQKSELPDYETEILTVARQITQSLEGLYVTKAVSDEKNTWCVSFVTISEAYDIAKLERQMTQAVGVPVSLKKLAYDYGTCIKLLDRKNAP